MVTLSSAFGTLDISTRPKRRQVVALIIMELSRLRLQEEAYMQRIPQNLQYSEAASAAEDSIDLLTDAIDALEDAY